MDKKHLGFDCLVLENDNIKVAILPELGMKVASIYHKEKDFEFLFQPSKGSYDKAEYAGDFAQYDTSGLDDCIPTIDACKYPDTDIDLPDHGDTWSLAYDIKEVDDRYVVGQVKLKSLPLTFEKRVELAGKEIKIDYKVINDTDKEYAYLWAFHGLNNYNESTRLEFPQEYQTYINVQNEEVWDFDIRILDNFRENHTFKWYFTDELESGKVSLIHDNPGLKYTINFDPKENPYLGVWLTTGGFKNEKNVAIEPCNGFYDSLEKAVANGKYKTVEAGTEDTWSVKIQIEEI